MSSRSQTYRSSWGDEQSEGQTETQFMLEDADWPLCASATEVLSSFNQPYKDDNDDILEERPATPNPPSSFSVDDYRSILKSQSPFSNSTVDDYILGVHLTSQEAHDPALAPTDIRLQRSSHFLQRQTEAKFSTQNHNLFVPQQHYSPSLSSSITTAPSSPASPNFIDPSTWPYSEVTAYIEPLRTKRRFGSLKTAKRLPRRNTPPWEVHALITVSQPTQGNGGPKSSSSAHISANVESPVIPEDLNIPALAIKKVENKSQQFVHYRGASFEVLNPHASFLDGARTFETPAAEIDGLLDDYFDLDIMEQEVDNSVSANASFVEDPPSRRLYEDAFLAHRRIRGLPSQALLTPQENTASINPPTDTVDDIIKDYDDTRHSSPPTHQTLSSTPDVIIEDYSDGLTVPSPNTHRPVSTNTDASCDEWAERVHRVAQESPNTPLHTALKEAQDKGKASATQASTSSADYIEDGPRSIPEQSFTRSDVYYPPYPGPAENLKPLHPSYPYPAPPPRSEPESPLDQDAMPAPLQIGNTSNQPTSDRSYGDTNALLGISPISPFTLGIPRTLVAAQSGNGSPQSPYDQLEESAVNSTYGSIHTGDTPPQPDSASGHSYDTTILDEPFDVVAYERAEPNDPIDEESGEGAFVNEVQEQADNEDAWETDNETEQSRLSRGSDMTIVHSAELQDYTAFQTLVEQETPEVRQTRLAQAHRAMLSTPVSRAEATPGLRAERGISLQSKPHPLVKSPSAVEAKQTSTDSDGPFVDIDLNEDTLQSPYKISPLDLQRDPPLQGCFSQSAPGPSRSAASASSLQPTTAVSTPIRDIRPGNFTNHVKGLLAKPVTHKASNEQIHYSPSHPAARPEPKPGTPHFSRRFEKSPATDSTDRQGAASGESSRTGQSTYARDPSIERAFATQGVAPPQRNMRGADPAEVSALYEALRKAFLVHQEIDNAPLTRDPMGIVQVRNKRELQSRLLSEIELDRRRDGQLWLAAVDKFKRRDGWPAVVWLERTWGSNTVNGVVTPASRAASANTFENQVYQVNQMTEFTPYNNPFASVENYSLQSSRDGGLQYSDTADTFTTEHNTPRSTPQLRETESAQELIPKPMETPPIFGSSGRYARLQRQPSTHASGTMPSVSSQRRLRGMQLIATPTSNISGTAAATDLPRAGSRSLYPRALVRGEPRRHGGYDVEMAVLNRSGNAEGNPRAARRVQLAEIQEEVLSHSIFNPIALYRIAYGHYDARMAERTSGDMLAVSRAAKREAKRGLACHFTIYAIVFGVVSIVVVLVVVIHKEGSWSSTPNPYPGLGVY